VDITIEAMQAAFASADEAQITEALAIIAVPELRREMLETHGVDTTGMDDTTVTSTLVSHSRDGLD
jgi:hypothetical protein